MEDPKLERPSSLWSLLAIVGGLALCCGGPILLVLAGAGLGAAVVHSGTFLLVGATVAAVLAIAGFVWWRRRVCGCPTLPATPALNKPRSAR
jgi:hypothetical protein